MLPFLGDPSRNETRLAIFGARDFVLDNLILLLVLAVMLVLAGIFFSMTSQGALVDGVAALHRGEERGFFSAFRAGLSNFWRVLELSVLAFVILLVLLLPIFLIMLFSIPNIFARDGSSAASIVTTVLVFLFLFAVMLLILIPLDIIFTLGLQALVLDREGVFGSLGSGYRLLVRCSGRVLLTAVIFYGFSLESFITLLILDLCSSGCSLRSLP
jgi:hypothetical protein